MQFPNLDKALQSLPPPAVDVVIENSSIKDNVVITGGGQLTLKRVPVDAPNVDNGTSEVQLPGASATDSVKQDGMGPLPTNDVMEDRDKLKEGSPVVEEGRKTGLDDDSQATLEEEDAGQDTQSSTSS
ncbi:hypothetical protein CC1G_02159 [Coprinopsis cinerea okayama7|uniref:Uncharacterized protein n=1 Tax=Coprinopsis cinerea (strain Okayama-7 / 130 / ATCC MYA-4618 / FGSC 9003) TaxID=240176 RepID=A8NKE2_COPC7|nr:hypothetical protein CC1G_02159 [Coprinopsis cinerea okayama7\|eukprot:XP_001834423.1 hypothetical protein CC1G_02159 [Coprinopsis cinerea okayama7\